MMEQKIENYTEYLFSLALQKCGNFADAEDLTQEVLLAACSYQTGSGRILNLKAWLSSTLNHKYYDMLRRKYNMPTVSIDMLPEEPLEENDGMNSLLDMDRLDEEQQVRKEVAYLAEMYREVIIRHYFLGQKIQQIADDLSIPRGTVVSRLYAGREQMRKGLEKMEQYEKQSYIPEQLEISCHGQPGFHDEPWSLIADDMMKQNILIVAYEKPVTCVEIARGLGIPVPYIEKAVEDLVASELMCCSGSHQVFTDFMIVTPKQLLKTLDVEIELAESHFHSIWSVIEEAFKKLKDLTWYGNLSQHERISLEYYYILHLFSSGIYTAIGKIIPVKENYPNRPNGGKWVAVGNRFPRDFDFNNYRVGKYCYGGERKACIENWLNQKYIALHVYDTQPDLNKFEHGPVEIHEDNLSKLLYIIKQGIPMEVTGFDPVFLQDIPHLVDCGILCMENGNPKVAIPVLGQTDFSEMEKLRVEQMNKLARLLEAPLRKVFPQLKIEIPKHLEGRVAEFRQYSSYAIPMAVIKRAIAEGKFLQGITGPVPPMVLVISGNGWN